MEYHGITVLYLHCGISFFYFFLFFDTDNTATIFFLLNPVTDILLYYYLNFYDRMIRGLYAATTSLQLFPINNSIIPFPVIFNYIESGTNLVIKYSFSAKKIILS